MPFPLGSSTHVITNATTQVMTVLAIALLITSCGWQLRGTDNKISNEDKDALSHLSVFIQYPQKLSAIHSLLEKSLKSLGIQIESNAAITMELASERIEKRPMAYGSTGIPIQYQITITAQYAIHVKSAELVQAVVPVQSMNTPETIHTKKSPKVENPDVELKKVISRRTLDFDPELVSAKDHEEQELHAEMRKEIVHIILRDLRNVHVKQLAVSRTMQRQVPVQTAEQTPAPISGPDPILTPTKTDTPQ